MNTFNSHPMTGMTLRITNCISPWQMGTSRVPHISSRWQWLIVLHNFRRNYMVFKWFSLARNSILLCLKLLIWKTIPRRFWFFNFRHSWAMKAFLRFSWSNQRVQLPTLGFLQSRAKSATADWQLSFPSTLKSTTILPLWKIISQILIFS